MNPVENDDAITERCTEYLLGELSAQQSREFEQQLANSPQLNRELLVQAELLCALSTPDAPVEVIATSTPSLMRRAITAISALAACLAIAFVGIRSSQNSDNNVASIGNQPNESNDQTLLIAQVWASQQADATNIDEAIEPPETEFDLGLEELPEDDSVVSWMVAAVADENASETAVTSDG